MTRSVVHVISGLGVGGAERALFNLLNNLSFEERCESTVVSLTSLGTYGPKIQALGITVKALGLGRKPASWLGLVVLRGLLRELAPTAVVAWMYHANIVAWLASRGLPSPPRLVWNIRHCLYELTDEKPLTRLVIRAHRWLRGGVSAIVFNSYLSRDQHVAFGIDSTKCMVIPNGFDTTVWCPDKNDRATVRQTLGIPCNARVVGHVGRYHPLKDQETLLGAMQKVMLRHPNVYLLLIGRGVSPDNSKLKGYFDRLPMDRVCVMGERLDVPCLVRTMDVLCLSSRSEAFPNVLGEAMASGVVCVTTDVGDAREVVGDIGSVVPPCDASALGTAVESFVVMGRAELRRKGLAARARIEQRYAIERTIEAYQKLLSERSSI